MPPSFLLEGNMYNSPYYYNSQMSLEKIDKQIEDLQKMKNQIQQPVQPTNLTQNFQIAPTREMMRYANSIEDVQKETVYGTTPFFSNDMSVLWVKNTPNSIKTYELKEIIPKDEKDLKIEFLQAQIDQLKKGMKIDAKSDIEYANESTKNEESTNAKDGGTSTKKSK